MRHRVLWDYAAIGLALFGALALVGAEVHRSWPRDQDAAVPVLPAALRGRIGLIVIFRTDECAGYRNFLASVEELEKQSLPVVGVPLDGPADKSKLRTMLVGLDPAFPLAPEAASSARVLLAMVGVRTTPIAILLDASGRPAMLIPPHESPYGQAELVRIAANYSQIISEVRQR